MKNYEIMYIIRTTISEEEVATVAHEMEDILTNNGAKIIESVDRGQHELAYEIKKYKAGHYYVITLESKDDKAIKEFDRVAQINPNIIRHLITKKEA